MRDVAEILLRSLAIFLLLGSLLGMLVALGLVFRRSAAIAACGRMNRWVSTRRALKPLEIPRATDAQLESGNRRLVTGAIFAACGAYAAYALAANVDTARVVATFGIRGHNALLAGIGIDTTRWVLIVGCAAGALAGVLLMFYPDAWARAEAWGNRWVSTRRAMAGADTMITSLDQWVEAFPRASGVVIGALSLIPALAALLLFTARF